ncbi:hypothetical protein J6V85_02405 [Candidatus Saccharibacteria bacterium]|nr:hypothetical protein [Candidatus Saccharibacteria bacterium]
MKTEKMEAIFQTVLVENISNCCGNSIEEIFEYLAYLGFSKKEAFDFVVKNYLDGINWQSDDEDETEDEPPKLVPVPDYFRFITMLDKAAEKYRKLNDYIIELYQDAYNTVEFHFNTNFELVGVEW